MLLKNLSDKLLYPTPYEEEKKSAHLAPFECHGFSVMYFVL